MIPRPLSPEEAKQLVANTFAALIYEASKAINVLEMVARGSEVHPQHRKHCALVAASLSRAVEQAGGLEQ